VVISVQGDTQDYGDTQDHGNQTTPAAAAAVRPDLVAAPELGLAVDALDAAEVVVKAAAEQVLRTVRQLSAARYGASALTVYRDKGGRCYIDMRSEGRARRLALIDKDLYLVTERAACLCVGVGETRTFRG